MSQFQQRKEKKNTDTFTIKNILFIIFILKKYVTHIFPWKDPFFLVFAFMVYKPFSSDTYGLQLH